MTSGHSGLVSSAAGQAPGESGRGPERDQGYGEASTAQRECDDPESKAFLAPE